MLAAPIAVLPQALDQIVHLILESRDGARADVDEFQALDAGARHKLVATFMIDEILIRFRFAEAELFLNSVFFGAVSLSAFCAQARAEVCLSFVASLLRGGPVRGASALCGA